MSKKKEIEKALREKANYWEREAKLHSFTDSEPWWKESYYWFILTEYHTTGTTFKQIKDKANNTPKRYENTINELIDLFVKNYDEKLLDRIRLLILGNEEKVRVNILPMQIEQIAKAIPDGSKTERKSAEEAIFKTLDKYVEQTEPTQRKDIYSRLYENTGINKRYQAKEETPEEIRKKRVRAISEWICAYPGTFLDSIRIANGQTG